MLRAASTWWSSLPSPQRGPEWALPAVAAGIAIAGISLGVVLLSWLARSVAHYPYRWLGPVLVGFALLVLQGMHVVLPWKTVPYPLFVGLSGFALLAGGAVMQIDGWPAKASGTFVLLLPLATLLAGYAVTGGLGAAVHAEGAPLVWLVLGLTAVGVGIAALVGRSENEVGVARLRQRYERQRLELVDAHERNRWTAARLAAAEQRASLASQGIYAPGYDDDAAAFAAAARPRSLWPWLMLGVGIIGLGLAGGLYFAMYRPLLERVASQQAVMTDNTQGHAAELEQLRRSLEAKQQGLQAELTAARAQLVATQTAAQSERSGAAALVEEKPAEATVEQKPQVEAKRASAKAKRAAARKAKRAARVAAAAKSEPAQKPEPAAKPVAAKPAAKAKSAPESEADSLDAKMLRALKVSETANDDPIGGLDSD